MSLDAIAAGLQGFGHPLRIRLLVLMDDQEWSPRDLAQALDAPLGVVSYHVRMARDYGLVDMVRSEPRRGALAHFYRRTPECDTILRKLNGMLSVPGRGGKPNAARRREQLTKWALATAA